MESVLDEIRSLSDAYLHELPLTEIYESALDSCRFRHSWPWFGCRTPWLFHGMTNHVLPLWVVVVGADWGDKVGFVWDTKTNQSDLTVQEITGVKCLFWKNRSSKRNHGKERMNRLGSTKLSIYSIVEAGLLAFCETDLQETDSLMLLGVIIWSSNTLMTSEDCGCL